MAAKPKLTIMLGGGHGGGRLSGGLEDEDAPESDGDESALEEAMAALAEALSSGDTSEAARAFRAACELCSMA